MQGVEIVILLALLVLVVGGLYCLVKFIKWAWNH